MTFHSEGNLKPEMNETLLTGFTAVVLAVLFFFTPKT
jgi:hypothetical protein